MSRSVEPFDVVWQQEGQTNASEHEESVTDVIPGTVSESFHYFAYGSNLKLSEMQRTYPSARRHATAVLADHRLTFPRRSVRRNCGVAGVQPEPGSRVWGGVYTIAQSDRSRLECREGFRIGREMSQNGYYPQWVTVHIEGVAESSLDVLTFCANIQADPPLPSADYLGLILDGAREWNLDPDYVAQLEQIRTS